MSAGSLAGIALTAAAQPVRLDAYAAALPRHVWCFPHANGTVSHQSYLASGAYQLAVRRRDGVVKLAHGFWKLSEASGHALLYTNLGKESEQVRM